MYISKAFINIKTNLKYWLNYALRRFLRIYPLFFISLIIYFVLFKVGIVNDFITDFKIIKDHLFLTKAYAMYWSIGVEFKYYVISPFILLICVKYLNGIILK